MERAIALVQQAQDASRAFFDSLTRIGESDEGKSWADSEPAKTVRVRKPGAVTNVLTQAMRDLSMRLSGLKDKAKVDADRYELNSYSQRAEMIAAAAEAAKVSQTVNGALAYWVEVSGEEGGGTGGTRTRRSRSRARRWRWGRFWKERLFRAGEGKPKSVVLTSRDAGDADSEGRGID